MPYLRFSFLVQKSYFFILAVVLLSSVSYGAEWRACEKAKLRELELQRGSMESKPVKGKKRRQESRSERIEEIDTWLWKNCREYSYELRQLEQEHM